MSTCDDIPTVADICDEVGRKVIQERVGVGKTAVSAAVSAGEFPARWFPDIRDLCSERGIPCPEDLFNFARNSRRPETESAAQ